MCDSLTPTACVLPLCSTTEILLQRSYDVQTVEPCQTDQVQKIHVIFRIRVKYFALRGNEQARADRP